MRERKLCRICQQPTLYGDLYCGLAHQRQAEERDSRHRAALLNEGFEQDGNIFRKNGVAVTLGKVGHIGLDKALERHAQAVANRPSA